MVTPDFLEALAQLLSAIFWPLIVLLLLIYFGPPTKRFLQQSEEASVGAMGVEATFRRSAEPALLYGLSVAEEYGVSEQFSDEDVEELLSELQSFLTPETRSGLSNGSILWVDDTPENNRIERETLESLGIDIVSSTSTSDAIGIIRRNDYDVIISDMGRPEGDRAGYDLLERKQELGDTAPFIIYSYPVKEKHKKEARRQGAFGSTDSPRELYQMVNRALGGSIEIDGDRSH